MEEQTMDKMKLIDVVSASVLFIGGLNWGLVGFFNFDLVAFIFGHMTFASRIIYGLVGVCAIYEAVSWSAIQRRWQCSGFWGETAST